MEREKFREDIGEEYVRKMNELEVKEKELKELTTNAREIEKMNMKAIQKNFSLKTHSLVLEKELGILQNRISQLIKMLENFNEQLRESRCPE